MDFKPKKNLVPILATVAPPVANFFFALKSVSEHFDRSETNLFFYSFPTVSTPSGT